MLPGNPTPFHEVSFTEVVAADFGAFQIVVPTTSSTVKRSFGSAYLTIPSRKYGREGWVICQDQMVGNLCEMEVGGIIAPNCPFKPIKHLGPAVPIDFETRSYNPLPPLMSHEACFSCQVEDDKALPYCSVFRQLLPRFVRVYPFQPIRRNRLRDAVQTQVLHRVQKLLEEEGQFVAEHLDQLKEIPFYREKFNLAG